ncbi:MAG: tRNA uracil 4-sulfurtransferase ThiI [Planctomycetota bacterium]
MAATTLLVHYHELALKGANRKRFEERLAREIREFLKPFAPLTVRRIPGRLRVEPSQGDAAGWQEALRRLPGIANTIAVSEFDPEMEVLEREVPALVPAGHGPFAVRARRDAKHYAFTSADIGRRVGAAVQKATGRPVDLTDPEVEVVVEIAGNRAYAGAGLKIGGYEGLPVGVAGKGILLLSGGFDSPVAGHLMQCRGLEIHALHCHSAPMVSAASLDKVRDLCRVLGLSQSRLRLFEVGIVDLQRAVVAKCPERLRTLLYRRSMMRLGSLMAWKLKARALVTGDSLGQVASQTLENLEAVSAAAKSPVLRPLIGMGKSFILDKSRFIGTHDISKLPHEDCCGFLAPQSPATRSTAQELEEAEKALDFATFEQAAFDARKEKTYECGKPV